MSTSTAISPAPAHRSDSPLALRQDTVIEPLLDMLSREPTTPILDVVAELGIPLTTWWRWRKDSTFLDELNNRARSGIRAQLPAVYAALLKKAVAGNVKAGHEIREIVGDVDLARQSGQLEGYVELLLSCVTPAARATLEIKASVSSPGGTHNTPVDGEFTDIEIVEPAAAAVDLGTPGGPGPEPTESDTEGGFLSV